MLDKKLSYQELLAKFEQLQSENKQLRLRPAVHSADARLLDFMKIKSQLANAMLKANDIKHAIRTSVQYLSKIDNIHGLGFFKYNENDKLFEILQENKLPKKFLNQLKNDPFSPQFLQELFPSKNTFYANVNNDKKSNSIVKEYLKSYVTILILPIIDDGNSKYSLLLISRKIFKNSRIFKIVYENIQAQLRSSYSRLLNNVSDEAKNDTDEPSEEVPENNFENINKELLRQLKVYRGQNIQISEELDLYKSIITQQKDIILRINREGQILYHNPAFKQINTHQNGDDKRLFNYLGEGDFPGLEQILHDFEEGIQQVNCEIQMQDDYLKWFNFFFSPIKNKRGLIVEIQIVARNIDKIMRLEQKLELQKEMLVNMLNESDYLGFAIDKKGYINMVTNNLERKTGLEEHHFIHQVLQDLVDINGKKEIEKYLQSSLDGSSFKTKIFFSNPDMIIQHFKLELNPLKFTSVNNQYFIGNLYPLNQKPAN